jgi:hypothetical protein
MSMIVTRKFNAESNPWSREATALLINNEEVTNPLIFLYKLDLIIILCCGDIKTIMSHFIYVTVLQSGGIPAMAAPLFMKVSRKIIWGVEKY